MLLLALPASAAPPKADKVERAEAAFFEAFNDKDWPKAIDAARFWASVDPDDYVPRYNLATLLGATGKPDEAAEQLAAAVERGFADRRRLDTDPGLRPVRESPAYATLIERWPALLDAQLDRQLARANTWWSTAYSTARDGQLRVAYASAFSPQAFGRARDEMTRLSQWWEASVLPEGTPGVSVDPQRPDPWVLVVLPSRMDYNKWAAKRWPRASGATSLVAGIYDHYERQLVAQDVGGTLRHEFLHALHWRHQDRLRQDHPIWIQEGLCSLVEDVEVAADETLRPVPSWRTNSLKALVRSGKAPSISRLLEMSQDTFVGTAPLANYALARAVFLYLADRGKLRAWYTDYTQNFREDRTGRAALERVLGKPLADIERDFRAWVRALPEVATANKPGGAMFPGTYENGIGEGVVVKRAGRGTGLADGDVIVEIAGQPVTDLNDLTRVLGDFEPGSRVDLRFRRGKGRSGQMQTATLTLVAR
ncbi:MAG: TPR end-of-group domain-containing protein [Phycisphaerales bacterium]